MLQVEAMNKSLHGGGSMKNGYRRCDLTAISKLVESKGCEYQKEPERRKGIRARRVGGCAAVSPLKRPGLNSSPSIG
jgi:hypothetical protein